MTTETVTLDKAYFETLLRRAHFHTDGVDYTTPANLLTVTIPKIDHDSLLNTAHQYANLRQNLYRGGISEETLAILIKDDTQTRENGDSTHYSTVEESSEGGVFLPQQSISAVQAAGAAHDYTFGRNANYTPRSNARQRETNGLYSHSQTNDDYAFMQEGLDGLHDGGSGNNDSQGQLPRQKYDKFAKRTVLLANLPDGVSHADIVEGVRGGMLLDIYLRTHDRTASLSFLEEKAAQDFFRYVKRHDLYIRGKRVEIRWNDRQFILPGHVANKIAIGATRNLVIHNRSPKNTEEAIREDLDHIHNLVVIKVTFSGQDAYISTNSVHNAMFARTCMMSRATYKGCKIEWGNDECAAPLDRPLSVRKANIPTKKQQASLANRFQLLDMSGTEDGSEDDDHDNSGITLTSAMSSSTIGVVA